MTGVCAVRVETLTCRVSWHAHPIGRDCGGRKPRGPVADIETYFRQPNSIINLAYPDGFGADGRLSVIPGAHLVRDPSMPAASTDEELHGWLDGKTHPVTNTPLAPMDLGDLPPGSIVCGLSHAPHRVAPSQPRGGKHSTRYATIMTYKTVERSSGICWPPGALPPVWALMAQRKELPEVLNNLFRNGYDRGLTGGRIWSSDPTEDYLEEEEEDGGSSM